MIIGVDTGGTFTDFVYKEGETWGVYKVLSTPSNPAEAVLNGLNYLAHGRKKQIIHGSTVATNAILERNGAKTALITNKGFEDIIEIGRQNRTRLYDLSFRKAPHIIPSDLRFGLPGRILQTGEELIPLDIRKTETVGERLKDLDVESVAVCFLFSYVNPSHEQKIRELLAPLGLQLSLSHEVLAEFREFERTSTTVINAYVSPKMQRYIGHLIEELGRKDSLGIMQSNGGSISAETAMNESVKTILSGPAGGAVGAYEIGKMAGYSKLITFDMGGTSTDVSLIDGNLSLAFETHISGYPVKVPMIDIHTVGAGGGSMVSFDEGGALKVGPESAGANPGPICYGKGDRITVTDANLYLGRLIPEHFLGGGMALTEKRLPLYFENMAQKIGLSPQELAQGILDVANTAMERAIRVISIERGYDPREFTLFSFGGAGGMHAAFLARLLNIPTVLLPSNPGILSAMGMLMADVIKDYSLTIMKKQENVTFQLLSEGFEEIETKGQEDLRAEGIPDRGIMLERYLDMRYHGQSYEIIVPFNENYVEHFHAGHEKTYGYRNPDKPVEIVNIRLRARGVPEKPRFQKHKKMGDEPPSEAFIGEKPVVFDQRRMPTKIMARHKLNSGNRIHGPAVLVEYSSTIVIPPFAGAFVDEYGNIIMDLKDGGER
ncbi:MAG: hydantoinase/oxoprolinase family protein [Deltaproteobacteria bacterium]|nr:hydantoinase/oxoprolinase family protein [Deltaproteobacteria bacterium]MBW1959142.1 hydantoinase/oxoprolinase family protein [Deltaproteobacteria bacterium]MBW2013839.1 hydantoinase/oxoprolinase family protein [Deltaproteobacteria bacterium]MBW2087370.1 hydantoinase/oxoprolinase family protein [Deltaproteobacteria bacterium]MBW2320608.1 hydantoinase/oxoprolinase family protein [Deltaproteobacteria bacterium]